MFGFGKTKAHSEIDALTLKTMLADGSALLIDVREPEEFAAERIKGAINAPLSGFNPQNLPDAAGRTIVLQCAGGKRSGLGLDQCAKAKIAVDTHLAGGIGAWKAAGLPVEQG
ncbi:sulfurtransferase [Novosphingobium fuchskuhlense]|uniref:Sulfurtransferase n=1 Tax=Novosphingobium fuchskuhlense TaxID=1117702 RepID=A0A124JWL1_9SPHN|nr:rhodanese-like domain-containing protein [Novosphingobium fuchskuhlense]KUR73427.1 sulfurtransferase [Novosphingobium fuchskuhlense]